MLGCVFPGWCPCKLIPSHEPESLSCHVAPAHFQSLSNDSWSSKRRNDFDLDLSIELPERSRLQIGRFCAKNVANCSRFLFWFYFLSRFVLNVPFNICSSWNCRLEYRRKTQGLEKGFAKIIYQCLKIIFQQCHWSFCRQMPWQNYASNQLYDSASAAILRGRLSYENGRRDQPEQEPLCNL